MQEQAEIFIFLYTSYRGQCAVVCPQSQLLDQYEEAHLVQPSLLPVNLHHHRTEVPGPLRPRAEECGQPQHRQGLLLQYAQCGAQRQDVEEEEAAQRRMLT